MNIVAILISFWGIQQSELIRKLYEQKRECIGLMNIGKGKKILTCKFDKKEWKMFTWNSTFATLNRKTW